MQQTRGAAAEDRAAEEDARGIAATHPNGIVACERNDAARIVPARGVSRSTVSRARMAYDEGGINALRPKPNGGRKHENMTVAEHGYCWHVLPKRDRRRWDVEYV